MIKKLTQFPKKKFAKKGKPFRLKCNAGNFQCGGSCKKIAYKNKKGQMAYTKCGKNAEGGAKTGLEWLQYVKSRRQRLKGKFGDRFTVDATGKVIQRRNQPKPAQAKQTEAKPAPKGAAKLPESPTARLTALQEALNQTNALLKKAPTPSLRDLKGRFEKQIDALRKQIRDGKPKPNLENRKPAPSPRPAIKPESSIVPAPKAKEQPKSPKQAKPAPKKAAKIGSKRMGELLRDKNFARAEFEDFELPPNTFKSLVEAKKVYRSLARKFHPDLGGSVEQMANLNVLFDQITSKIESARNKLKPNQSKPKTAPPPAPVKDRLKDVNEKLGKQADQELECLFG